MGEILLRNIDIITGDRNNWILSGKDICISGNRIKFIKDTGNNNCTLIPRIIDCTGKLAIPGLINAHTHTGMTLFRNYGNDLALHDWLFKKIFPAEEAMNGEEVYWGTMLGIAEMISSGTTACADMYLNMEDSVKAYASSGMRANLAPGPFRFISSPVPHLRNDVSWFKSFFKEWNGSLNGRISVYVQAHSVYILDGDHLKIISKLASDLDTGIHIHILETEKEINDSINMHGTDVLSVCMKYGILGRPVIAAHCTHLNQSDRDIFRKYGVNAVHNPVSNLKLGSGIADVPRMLDGGINVALGTDGPASNNSLDMLEELKYAALIHKGAGKDPLAVSSRQAFEMGTTNGAFAIGEGGSLGMVKEGYKADLVIIDLNSPHLRPLNDLTANVVYCAKGSDVQTVIIDGEIVMEDHDLKTIDIQKAMYMVDKAAKRIIG